MTARPATAKAGPSAGPTLSAAAGSCASAQHRTPATWVGWLSLTSSVNSPFSSATPGMSGPNDAASSNAGAALGGHLPRKVLAQTSACRFLLLADSFSNIRFS